MPYPLCARLIAAALLSAQAWSADPTPVIRQSTFIDGNSGIGTLCWEQVRDVDYDAAGNLYITGGTPSPDFPVLNAYDATFNSGGSSTGSFGAMDVFVTKLDPQGRVVWSTFIGGPNYDRAYAVEVGPDGDVYVAGRAGEGFPTTSGVIQPVFAGDFNALGGYGKQDGFIARFSPTGQLRWSTYFGDAGGSIIRDIDVDAAGDVHVAATNVQRALPWITANALQPTLRGATDAAYLVVAGDGRAVRYGTYLGGSDGGSGDGGNPAVRVAANGDAWILTWSNASDATITAGVFQPQRKGDYDLLLSRFRADRTLAFATWLGGSGKEELETHALAIDPAGNAYVTGMTSSSDFPVTAGAFRTTAPGGDVRNTYVAKVSPDGAQLLASTYLGSGGRDEGEGIAFLPATNEVVLTGNAGQGDFPLSADAPDRIFAGSEMFVTMLSADLQRLTFSTFIGGSGTDAGRGMAVSATGEVAAVGHTTSTDFPLVAAIDATLNGTWGGALVVLRRPAPVANRAPTAAVQTLTLAEDATKAVTLAGSDPDGNALTYRVITGPAHGTLTGTPPTLTYRPTANWNGSDSFTFDVSDGALSSAAATVSLTVTPVNDAPTISAIDDRTLAAGGATGAISFTIGDVETSATALTLSATSSNQVLVPIGNVVFGGSGANRTVTVTPVANQSGAATVTVIVSDGAATRSEPFVLTVTPALSWKINFQPPSSPVPGGFLVDSGKPFAARGNGATYGWNLDLSAATNLRDRNHVDSPDQQHDTHLLLGVTAAQWNLVVPNGSYQVRVVMGDPYDPYMPDTYRLTAEGVGAIDGTATTTLNWLDNTVVVSVSDGQLTLATAGGTALTNKLCFIEIIAVPAGNG